MDHVGEVWRHSDSGVVAVILLEQDRTPKPTEVALAGIPGIHRYAELPALGWTRLPWRIALTPDALPEPTDQEPTP